jgi:hypothetical protein
MALQKVFGDLRVIDSVNIISIQNKVIREIRHQEITTGSIKILKNLNSKAGSCYDRSLILQKVLLLNGFKIRPVYLFFLSSQKETSWYDFFRVNLHSHAIFEFFYRGSWFVMRTNSAMSKFENIDEYLLRHSSSLKNARYIRHLSNRNGKFLFPTIIPDVY